MKKFKNVRTYEEAKKWLSENVGYKMFFRMTSFYLDVARR